MNSKFDSTILKYEAIFKLLLGRVYSNCLHVGIYSYVSKQGGYRERCDRSSATGCDYRALSTHVIIY